MDKNELINDDWIIFRSRVLMLLREGRKIEFHNVKTIQRNCCGNNIEIVLVRTSKKLTGGIKGWTKLRTFVSIIRLIMIQEL